MSNNSKTVFKEAVSIRVKINKAMRSRMGENIDLSVVVNKMKIGSSFKAGTSDPLRGLSFEEEKKFLPQIIGVTPTSENWSKATRDYWLNISKVIPNDERGLVLEVGMRYDNEEDAKKGNDEANRELNRKINYRKDNKAFVEKFNVRTKIGHPINIADYILYRYCLLYSRVANDVEDIDKSNNIKFYIHSQKRSTAVAKAGHKIRLKASTLYLGLVEDTQKVNNILTVLRTTIQLHNNNILNIDNQITLGDTVDNSIALEKIVNKYPNEFIKVAEDDKLNYKAFIERSITKGILKRLANTDTIIFGDNTNIGNTLDEAVIYLSDDKNKTVLQTIKAKLTAFDTK